MSSLKLYYFASGAPSRAVLMTARQLKQDIDVKPVNPGNKEQMTKEYLKMNPQHTVPVLDDNGYFLWESRAIMAYLVDTRSSDHSLYPKDHKSRAVINQRLYFDASVFYPIIRNICRPVLFAGVTTISDEKQTQLKEALTFLEQFLEGRKWFTGDNVTLADLSLLASLSSIACVGVDLTPYPKLKAWYENCGTLPGYEENMKGAVNFGERVKANLKEGF